MSLYADMVEIANVLQKIGNINLYKKQLDLSVQALELHNRIVALTEENEDLKEKENIKADIKRHEELYVTRISENHEFRYCTHCWDAKRKTIQIECYGNGKFCCPDCNFKGVYDKELKRNSPSVLHYGNYSRNNKRRL